MNKKTQEEIDKQIRNLESSRDGGNDKAINAQIAVLRGQKGAKDFTHETGDVVDAVKKSESWMRGEHQGDLHSSDD